MIAPAIPDPLDEKVIRAIRDQQVWQDRLSRQDSEELRNRLGRMVVPDSPELRKIRKQQDKLASEILPKRHGARGLQDRDKSRSPVLSTLQIRQASRYRQEQRARQMRLLRGDDHRHVGS